MSYSDKMCTSWHLSCTGMDDVDSGLPDTSTRPGRHSIEEQDGPDALFEHLLRLLKTHEDREHAIAVALNALISLQQLKVWHPTHCIISMTAFSL